MTANLMCSGRAEIANVVFDWSISGSGGMLYELFTFGSR